jgi:hypothetical protein
MSDNVITIDGQEYDPNDLDENENYLIAQIKDLQAKSAKIRFDLDQVTIAQNAFTNELIQSVKNKEAFEKVEKAQEQ